MTSPVADERIPKTKLAACRVLQSFYGTTDSRKLLAAVSADYNCPVRRAVLPPAVVAAVRYFDSDGEDGLGSEELDALARDASVPLYKLAAVRILQSHYAASETHSVPALIVADYNDPVRRAALPSAVLEAMQAFDEDGSESLEEEELETFYRENIAPPPTVAGVKVLASYYATSDLSELRARVKADYEDPARRAVLPRDVLASIQLYDRDGDDTIDEEEVGAAGVHESLTSRTH